MGNIIYMDNAATTRVDERVWDAMKPYLTEYYGNPASIYSFAEQAKAGVDEAREILANGIGARSQDIYFTGGGSESDNWALKATAEAYKEKGKHIITTAIEHHAILHTCQWLEKEGYEVTYLKVDENGLVDPKDVESAIRPDTILVSIMMANNEIGTIEPIKEIGAITREKGVLFHTDAVQAFGHIPINVDEMNIDMLSASAHKINGPKGVGLLYIRKGIKIRSFIHGGAQERQRRAGTLNVPGIVGFGQAAKLAFEKMDERSEYERRLRDHLIERVLQ
ncbi:MAG: aminotransferase class V-fold PLP-dependent enzyme, partial [Lachnospiraceae bacterium]|nr:aminotransferase class V-fold PLP-dependent enzyme [Lachnospiraceae bacterium]